MGAGAIRPHQLASFRCCRDMTYPVTGTWTNFVFNLQLACRHACQYAPPLIERQFLGSSGTCLRTSMSQAGLPCLKSNALSWAGSSSFSCLGGTAFWKEVGARTSARPRTGEAKGRTLVLVLEIGPSSQHAIFCPARASRTRQRKAPRASEAPTFCTARLSAPDPATSRTLLQAGAGRIQPWAVGCGRI